MTISNAIQADMAFKDFKRKAYTNLLAKFFEENRSRNRFLPAQFILGEDIPYPPPASDTEVIEWWDVPLTLDNGTPNRRTWVITAPGKWKSGWDLSQDQTDVGYGFVDPAMGGPLWIAKLYRGSAHSGERVPEGHTSDWDVDYDTGIVRFNSETPPETGTSPADSPRIVLGRYRGKSILDVISGAQGKLILRGNLIGDSNGVNQLYTLPTGVDLATYYEIRCSKVPLDPDDFVINGNQITLASPPMAYQTPDIVYYLQ